MEVKKNPQADLNKDRSLYFSVGLLVTLASSWIIMESKTYEIHDHIAEVIEVEQEVIENIPITHQVLAPPPPPPPSVASSIIEIVEDEVEITEGIIESSESNQEMALQEYSDGDQSIVGVGDITVEKVEEDITIPFAVIENVPVYPGCEKLKKQSELKTCFSSKIQEHIKRHFTYPETALELGIHGKVQIQFEISNTGEVTNFKKRGPDKILEDEALRIMSLLPKMTPGKQRGKPVSVRYNIPINFVLGNR